MTRRVLCCLVIAAVAACSVSADAAVPRDGGIRAPSRAPRVTNRVDAGLVFTKVVPDAGVEAGVDAGVDAGTTSIVRFVAFGDQGKGNQAQYKVGDAVGKVCATKGCDFVLLLGDNFYPTGVGSVTDPQWQTAFVRPYSTVDAGFYVTLGNHDYGASGRGTDFARALNEVNYSKVNPKWILPGSHYKFTSGPAEFFSADTNRSMFQSDDAVRVSFESWLPASLATWKIVFAHHTYRSNGPHGNAGHYEYSPIRIFPFDGSGVQGFIENKVCGRADVYLCGHDHTREWLKTTCSRPGSKIETELIVSGGGADMTGFVSGGKNPYYWHSETSGFLYVVIEDRTFTGTFYDSNGVAEFTRSFSK